MKTQWRLFFVIALVLCESAWGLIVLDTDYTVETYATYSCPETPSAPSGMTFDAHGNLYLSQWGDYNSNEGVIYRISPDRSATKWSDGLGTPRRMVWSGGTAYGEYLYVTDATSRNIARIDLDGNVSTFVSVSAMPHSLILDRTGDYGGFMYTATRGQDHTYRITTGGTATMFSNFPNTVPGGPMDMDFDPGTDYGGLMYMATDCPYDPELSGLFALDTSGNAAKFAPDIVTASNVEIDPSILFGGELFVSGKTDYDQPYYSLWRVDPTGEATIFADGPIGTFTFGPDGAMYVPEYSELEQMVVISRITPEPATILLLGLGGLALLRRRRQA